MEEQQKRIRILVADDHPVVRQGLVLMFKFEPSMETVGEAGDGREAVELYHQHRPDVVLMDLRMSGMDGAEAISEIRREDKNACIIVLTSYDCDEDVYRALRAGATSYLLKSTPPEQILETVKRACAGSKYISPEAALKLGERIQGDELTERETEVLREMAKGKSNEEIAAALNIAQGTVKTHVNHILGKLQAADRTQAVIIAYKRGLARL